MVYEKRSSITGSVVEQFFILQLSFQIVVNFSMGPFLIKGGRIWAVFIILGFFEGGPPSKCSLNNYKQHLLMPFLKIFDFQLA